LIIEPDFDAIKAKTFAVKTVQSTKRWCKGLFKIRFMFPLNDKYFWSKIYLFAAKANIEVVSQTSEERFSHDINTGVVLHTDKIKTFNIQHSDKSFNEIAKQIPIFNVTNSFNEISMQWTNEKIVWKLNDHNIKKVDIKNFSSGNENIEQVFNETFRLIMAITLRPEFYNDSNITLDNIKIPYFYIDYIRVYKWIGSEIKQNSFPIANKTETNTHSNSVVNNKIIIAIIPVLLVIFVLLIIIVIVFRKLKVKHENNYSNPRVVYNNFPLIFNNESIDGIKTKIKQEFCNFCRRDQILIDRNDLLLRNCIGRGNFGFVYTGILNVNKNDIEEVVVKNVENCKFIFFSSFLLNEFLELHKIINLFD
jgi:hypothetical protein